MATTTWDQKSGMTSATDVDNLESYAEQAEASKDAAAASATAAAASATAAAASETASDASETASAASATAAATSATSASTSAATATTKAAEASTSATNAATSATAAATSATAAAASESAAATSETNAATSASSASAAADAALAALDNFDDRYLGQKASDPTVDNDGDPLVAGALYFNTTDDVMKVYEGSVWVAAYASLSGALLAANNLSDLNSAATARTNLGLGTAATTASTDYATAAQGALADSALQSSDIGVSVQGYSAVLAGTTASYTTAEETKLAGIEAGATADQTAAEIKTAYESNADTNAFTDAEQTKLAGIEALADVTDATNVAAAGAAMTANNLSDLASAATSRTNLGLGTGDSPTFTGVTATSAVSAASVTATGAVSAASVTATGTISAADLTVNGNAVATAGSLSTRNRIINGNFGVNQRAVSGTVTLSAGAYGHDRWKAGASGCTYTFATSNNVTTITISAGSLVQVVEGINIQSGTHVLSWSGTVQMTIDAGAAGNSGMTGTLTGGTNATVETSGTGTLSLVQLEVGDTATPFEHRSYGQELALCQRYFVMWRSNGGALDFPGVGFGYAASASQHIIGIKTPVTLRATPTVSFTGTLTLTSGSASAGNLSTVNTVYQNGPDGFWINCTNSASGGTNGLGSLLYCLNSTANSFSADAEL